MRTEKPNILPPTLREKERYLVFEYISTKQIELCDITDAMWNTSLQLFGEIGTSSSNLWIPSNLYNSERKRGIVKCNHLSVGQVRTILSAIAHIKGEPVAFSVLGVSGTIKSAKERYMRPALS